MKNILVIYAYRKNCQFDVFTITDREFEIMFPNGIDLATVGEAEVRINNLIPDWNDYQRNPSKYISKEEQSWLKGILFSIEYRRILLSQAKGIHATLYMDVDSVKLNIQTRIEDEINFENKTMSMFVYEDVFEYRYLPYYDPKTDGMEGMKNFLYVDLITSPCYCLEVYAITDKEFELLFGDTDITNLPELYDRVEKLMPDSVESIMKEIWTRRVPKSLAINGIHGVILDHSIKENIKYYPTRKIEEAINPDGTALRPYGATSTQKTALLPYQYIDFDEEDPNLTYEQINDLWDEAIDKIEHELGFSFQEEIVIKYNSISYNEWYNNDKNE